MAKYTDDRIEKALECCGGKGCKGCPFNSNCATCIGNLTRAALDLINRQEAEIDYWKRNAFDGCMERGRIAETARSEAIKEFAERLKRSLTEDPDCYFKEPVTSTQIDRLVKEMLGEGE